jgi:hypothetical protein
MASAIDGVEEQGQAVHPLKCPAILAESYLLSRGRYLERNPLEARLVAAPWEYAWFGCRAYALGEANALLGVNPYYQELAADAPGRQRWQELLLGKDLREVMVRRGEWAVGDAAFQQRLATVQGLPALRRRGHPRKQRPTV